MADEEEIPAFDLDVNDAPVSSRRRVKITDNQAEIDADLMVANRAATPNFDAQILKIQKNQSLKPSERLSLMKEAREKQHEFDRNERERKTLERGTTRETIIDEYDMRAEEKIKNNAEKEANKTLPKGVKYNEIEDPKLLKAWQKEYDKVYKSGIKEREEHKKERAKEKAKEEKEIAAYRAKAAKSTSKKGGRKTRKHGKKGKKYTKKSRRGRKHKTRKFRTYF